MKDHRILPKVVLFEGVNRMGKSTVIKEFQEVYQKQIRVVKFPHQKKIVSKIVFLYREIERLNGDMRKSLRHLEIIHQLFDLDFRQFCTQKNIDDLSKVYFLDRYYPSNLVYAAMHGVELNPLWSENHCLKPDITIHLHITFKESMERYLRDFPIYDGGDENHDETIANNMQVITPKQLLYDGQQFYNTMLYKLVQEKKLDSFHEVEALQEDTFRNCERILIRNGIL